MAETVGDIAVRVGADTSGLTRGLADADKSLQSFGSQAGALGGKLAALGAAAAAAGVAIGVALAAKGFQAVDALDEMAEKAGTSAKSLQSLQFALNEAGVNSEQTQAAIKKLNLAIGEAQGGNEKAQDTFAKLGLSVQQLASMDADQRFAAIADSLQGYGNAADRATVSSEIFGTKIGPDLAAALAQGGDAIRQAAKDLEDMGLAMSDVDAAQVANAMDAFGRAQAVIDGVANKLAVELAPLLEGISKAFLDAGKEGGGFGGAVSAAVQGAITVVGFFANAIDGVRRVGQLVADSLIYGWAALDETFSKVALNIISALNMIPGIDLTSNIVALEARVKQSQGVMTEAALHMREQFEKPLAGDQFRQFAEQAKQASREAAEATIAARKEAQGGEAVAAEESPAVAKAREDAAKLAKIEEEKRLKAAEQAALARETLVADQAARLMDLQNGLLTEKELLAKSFEEKRQQVLMANELGVGDRLANQQLLEQLEADHNAKLTDLEAKSAEERKRIAAQEAAAKLATVSSVLGQTSSLMNSGNRKMFEMGRAAAISNALISAYEGIGKAWGLGPILGPPMAAMVGLNAFANIANIRKQSFGGGGGSAPSSSNTTAINAGNTPVQGGGNAPTQRTNVTLVGDFFGRDQVVGLLNEAFRDGFTLST